MAGSGSAGKRMSEHNHEFPFRSAMRPVWATRSSPRPGSPWVSNARDPNPLEPESPPPTKPARNPGPAPPSVNRSARLRSWQEEDGSIFRTIREPLSPGFEVVPTSTLRPQRRPRSPARRSFSSTSLSTLRGSGFNARTIRRLSIARLWSIMTSQSWLFPAMFLGRETRRTLAPASLVVHGRIQVEG